MATDRKAILQELIKEVPEMSLCGPSDDPDEITSVSTSYYYLLTQIQTHASRILPPAIAKELRTIRVEMNDIYSVYEAKAKLDALLPDVEDALDNEIAPITVGLEKLLHPVILDNCYQQYCDEHLRDSVLNSIVAIFDFIRFRTGIEADGPNLVNKAFLLPTPI